MIRRILKLAFFCFLFSATLALAQPVTRDLVARYDFLAQDGTVVLDKVRSSYGLDLDIPDASKIQWLKPGMRVIEPTVVKARFSRDKLIADPFFTKGITVEAWLKPLNNTQSGPARIITFSSDSGNRNFTLGQAATQYVMRFRTSVNPGNGTNPATSTTTNPIQATPTLQHVVYTRDAAGAAKIYVDKVESGSASVPGDGTNWNNTYDFGLFNETSYPTDDRTWLGDIFLVSIYSTVLTPAEVAQNFDAGPPAMPVPGNGSAKVTLAWDANTEPDLAGYKVYYGKSSRGYTGIVNVVDAERTASCPEPYDPFKAGCCEITITGFDPGETYYFAATAYDDEDNESAYSEELSHTFSASTTVLSDPQNFREKDHAE